MHKLMDNDQGLMEAMHKGVTREHPKIALTNEST